MSQYEFVEIEGQTHSIERTGKKYKLADEEYEVINISTYPICSHCEGETHFKNDEDEWLTCKECGKTQ